MDVDEIEAWCKRKQIARENAVVLSGFDANVTDDVLLQALSLV